MSCSKAQFSLSKLSTCSLSYKSVIFNSQALKKQMRFARSFNNFLVYTISFSCSFCHLYTKISTYADIQYSTHKTSRVFFKCKLGVPLACFSVYELHMTVNAGSQNASPTSSKIINFSCEAKRTSKKLDFGDENRQAAVYYTSF